MPSNTATIRETDIPTASTDVRRLWRVVAPLCRMLNVLFTIQWQEGDGWGATVEDGNMVLQHPRDFGGGGGNALGPQWWMAVANGQIVYLQVNSAGPYLSLPGDAQVVNPYQAA